LQALDDARKVLVVQGRYDSANSARAIGSKRDRGGIGYKADARNRFFDALSHFRRHSRRIVDDAGHGGRADARQFSDILEAGLTTFALPDCPFCTLTQISLPESHGLAAMLGLL
jgi:hypothetical protein